MHMRMQDVTAPTQTYKSSLGGLRPSILARLAREFLLLLARADGAEGGLHLEQVGLQSLVAIGERAGDENEDSAADGGGRDQGPPLHRVAIVRERRELESEAAILLLAAGRRSELLEGGAHDLAIIAFAC